MGTNRLTSLHCDICTDVYDYGKSAKSLRKYAKAGGWKRIKGMDVCDICKNKLVFEEASK